MRARCGLDVRSRRKDGRDEGVVAEDEVGSGGWRKEQERGGEQAKHAA